MAPPKPPEEAPEEAEDWLATYADAVTLLMSFFILLVSFSKIDIPTFDAVMAGIRDQMNMGKEESTIEEMKVDIQDVVYEMQADQAVQVGNGRPWRHPGTVEQRLLRAGFRHVARSRAAGSRPDRPDRARRPIPVLQCRRRGSHRRRTQSAPRHSRRTGNCRRPARAGVVRFFGEQGIELQRLKASGFAETRPKVPKPRQERRPHSRQPGSQPPGSHSFIEDVA